MDYLDALARMRTEGDGLSLPSDDEARKEWPLLWEVLTCRTVMGNQQKQPARLTVQSGLACWSVALYDESLAMSLETVSDTLSGAFLSLERAMSQPGAWKVNRRKEPKLRELPENSKKTSGRKKRS